MAARDSDEPGKPRKKAGKPAPRKKAGTAGADPASARPARAKAAPRGGAAAQPSAPAAEPAPAPEPAPPPEPAPAAKPASPAPAAKPASPAPAAAASPAQTFEELAEAAATTQRSFLESWFSAMPPAATG
ncbi:MAG: hypothetical protein SNJ79_12100, partial [Sphingomonadaceae bacterium]